MPLITPSRVYNRHRRPASIAMTSLSRTLNLTNNDGQLVPDERTPLLKKERARFNNEAPCVSELDEEAARVLVDKSVPEEESRNIAGVISILLIGEFSPKQTVSSTSCSRKSQCQNFD